MTPEQIYQQMLITSIACGEPQLFKLLSDNIDRVWLIAKKGNPSCNPVIESIYVRKSLIEMAMNYSRNMVDVQNERGKIHGNESRKLNRTEKSTSQRSTVAEGCSWSTATNFRQYQRDAESKDIASSHSDTESNSLAFSRSFDRSRQTSTNWAWNSVNSWNVVNGDGSGTSAFDSRRESNSDGGTSAMFPTVDLDTGYVYLDDNLYLQDTISNGYHNPGRANPVCYDPTTGTTCSQLPSYGRGYNVNYDINIQFLLISVKINYSVGASFAQDWVCSHGTTLTRAATENRIAYNETDEGQVAGSGMFHDEGHTAKDIHRVGESHRTTTGKTDAGSSGISRATGQSKAEADRSAHGQRLSSAQQTGNSTRSMLYDYDKGEDQELAGEHRRWGQIFDSLSKMWKDTFAELQQAIALLNGKQPPVFNKMKAKNPLVPCAPIFNHKIDEYGDPCYDSLFCRQGHNNYVL